MSPTFQAVTRSDSLTGFGKVPAFTLRQSVGAENGRGAGLLGCLGLWTSCASRMKAPSGRASNDGMIAAGFSAGMLAAIGVLLAVGFGDTVGLLLSEGPRMSGLAQRWNDLCGAAASPCDAAARLLWVCFLELCAPHRTTYLVPRILVLRIGSGLCICRLPIWRE